MRPYKSPLLFTPLTITTLAFALVLLSGCKSALPPNVSNESVSSGSSAVVATVNGRPISAKIYEMYLKNGQQELGINPATDEGRKKLDVLREGIVSDLIDRMLVAEEAERRGLTITPDVLKEAERRTVLQFGDEKQYDDYLAEHHLTRDEYMEVVKWEIYGANLRLELSKAIDASAEDVRRYYEEHKTEPAFQLAERVRASHVLIAARSAVISQQLQTERKLAGDALARAVSDEMKRRRARAEEVRRKAAAGADFAALARQYSEDPSSREKGGDLGAFRRNSHPKAFDDAAFSLEPGAISPVVETDYGFHVIKVFEHQQPRQATLEEATPEIRRRIMAEREAAQLKDWLKEARRTARIQINEPYRFGSLRQEFPAS